MEEHCIDDSFYPFLQCNISETLVRHVSWVDKFEAMDIADILK